MKNGLLLSGVVTLSFVLPGLAIHTKQLGEKRSKTTVNLAQVFAADGTKPNDECRTAMDAVIAGAPTRGDYANPVLDHLHDELYRANKIATADIEMIFCRLVKVLGVEPDLTALPLTVTKTDPDGNTLVVTVETPTEAWATAAGYEAKATLKMDDATFMTLWWAGAADASKGYLVQGANPMAQDSTKRLRYAQWDKTGDTQTVSIYGAQFATTFLGSPAGATDSKTGGDNAHFLRVSYTVSTKAATAQSVEIRRGRDDTSAFACVRTHFTGVLGGSITGYRPAKGTEEPTSETSTGGLSVNGDQAEGCETATPTHCGLDGESGLADDKATANHAGTPVAGADLPTGTFDWSCADLTAAGATGKPFAGDTVDYATAPTAVFPN